MSALTSAVQRLRDVFPPARGASVVPLGGGLDHRAYLVGDLVLRLRTGDEGADLRHEAALLEAVGRRCPVAVPAPVACEASWVAYPLLDGIPLLELEQRRRMRHAVALGGALGEVLARLWAAPRDELGGLVEEDRTPLAEWRDEAAGLAATLGGELPADVRRGLARRFAAPLPADAPERVFSHNDLGCEHVLVRPDTVAVTGIIDWADAAVVDPAKDLGLILRDLGPAGFARAWNRARASLDGDDDPADRAHLYACCLALEDLAFGLETERAGYVAAARAALRRLTADG